jgi:hypothetical protein
VGLFSSKKETPNIDGIIHLILAGEDNWLQQVKQNCVELNFIWRFEIIKEVLPELDKVRARDLVRMLLTEKKMEAIVNRIIITAKERKSLALTLMCLLSIPHRSPWLSCKRLGL